MRSEAKKGVSSPLWMVPVKVFDHRFGKKETIVITVSTAQFVAAAVIWESDRKWESQRQLIMNICEGRGYSVLDIGKPKRMPFPEGGQEETAPGTDDTEGGETEKGSVLCFDDTKAEEEKGSYFPSFDDTTDGEDLQA